MKKHSIIKLSAMWSTDTLTRDVERVLDEKVKQGYEIISVSFGVNTLWMPTAFITVCK